MKKYILRISDIFVLLASDTVEILSFLVTKQWKSD